MNSSAYLRTVTRFVRLSPAQRMARYARTWEGQRTPPRHSHTADNAIVEFASFTRNWTRVGQ